MQCSKCGEKVERGIYILKATCFDCRKKGMALNRLNQTNREKLRESLAHLELSTREQYLEEFGCVTII